jgi:hypothetical protein
VGARDFGAVADSPIDQLQLRWFDWILKGKGSELTQHPPVRLFAMGSNQWLAYSNWPEPEPSALYLTSTGLAGMRQDDGKLVDNPDADSHGMDIIVHDPWRPVPSLGGHAGVPAGSFERGAIDCRSDVLTYTTAPLTEPLGIAGTPVAALFCKASAPSFDISIVLSEVLPDGQVMNLTQGHICVKPLKDNLSPPGQPQPESGDGSPYPIRQIEVPMQPSCFTVPVGHALRLSVAAACFPAYAVNAGTGEAPGQSHLIDQRIITLQVCHGGSTPSQVRLPKDNEGNHRERYQAPTAAP